MSPKKASPWRRRYVNLFEGCLLYKAHPFALGHGIGFKSFGQRVTYAISFIHCAFFPHTKSGVNLFFGVTFLSGGDAIFVVSIDRECDYITHHAL